MRNEQGVCQIFRHSKSIWYWFNKPYACVCVCFRHDGSPGWQCENVWMEQTSAAHLLQTSRQRSCHSTLFQLPGQQSTRNPHAHSHATSFPLFCLSDEVALIALVRSRWRRGISQSLASQPDVLQPQTLPGEFTSRLPKSLFNPWIFVLAISTTVLPFLFFYFFVGGRNHRSLFIYCKHKDISQSYVFLLNSTFPASALQI